MAKVCNRCGKKLGFLSSITKDGLCIPCDIEVRQAKEAQKREAVFQTNTLIDYIAKTRLINEKQYSYLESLDPSEQNRGYVALVDRFLADGELDVTEVEMLGSLYKRLVLDPYRSTFIDRVIPSLYVTSIRNGETLPVIPREPLMNMNIILKKGEVPHYFCNCKLKENKIVKTGFTAGSQGVSIRVMKGVSYRVGASRGYITKEEQLVETSRGTLLITNQRLFLNPEGNTKPLSIPINKILSYKCYDDGVVLYKEGREKPFVFQVNQAGEAETIGVCLSYLTANI